MPLTASTVACRSRFCRVKLVCGATLTFRLPMVNFNHSFVDQCTANAEQGFWRKRVLQSGAPGRTLPLHDPDQRAAQARPRR